MGSLKLYYLAGVLVFVHLFTATLGWGQLGHYATCKIAEGYFTEHTLAAVKNLLPESAQGELAAVCSSADLQEIRKERYPWSYDLHFSDTPDFMCNYDYCRDCHDSDNQKNRCVTGAIYNYTLQLVNAHHGAEVQYNLTEALMFLSHFMGDVHQPLHVGFVGDLGGNKVKLQWYNQTSNLHHVWDTEIIKSAMDRFYGSNLTNMIEAIKRNITDDWYNETEFWKACHHTVCPIRYASEGASLACKYAYRNATPGSILDDDYFLSRLPIVEKRLAEGGFRLAAILNRIYGYHAGIGKQAVDNTKILHHLSSI